MLVLSRRVDQAIVFGPHDGGFVHLTVLQTKKSTVRLAVGRRAASNSFARRLKTRWSIAALVASQGGTHSGAAAGRKAASGWRNSTAERDRFSWKYACIQSRGRRRDLVRRSSPHGARVRRGTCIVRLGITAPQEWLVYPEEAFGVISESADAPQFNQSQHRRTQSVAVTEILLKASSLKYTERTRKDHLWYSLPLRARKARPSSIRQGNAVAAFHQQGEKKPCPMS